MLGVRVWVGVVGILGALAMPALALAAPDVSVVQTAHQGETLWPVGPDHTGPVLITADPEQLNGEPDTTHYITFLSVVTNNGPVAASVTFTWHAAGLDEDPGYTYWTGPAQITTFAWQGNASDCDTDVKRCHFHLDSGEAYELITTVRGNAPGHFSLYSHVSAAGDPDTSNNSSEVFSEPVVCSIYGTSEGDTLTGTSSFDSICGGGGDDRIIAKGQADKVFGGAGNDLLIGQPRGQTFVGGRGADTVSYAGAPRRVRVSLADRGAQGWGYDTVIGIENVIGSRFPDYLEGSSKTNRLIGRGGGDQLFGRGGTDLLKGGGGADDFISRDMSADVVDGGPGADGAYRDSLDRLRSSYAVAQAAFANQDIVPSGGG